MIVADYLQKIEEYHKAKRLRLDRMEVPYSVGRDFYYAELYDREPELDDGHRFIRVFLLNADESVMQVGYLCVCGIFVDLIENPKSWYCVKRCGVDSHSGAEILSAEGLAAPYLLKPNYRDFVSDTSGYYTERNPPTQLNPVEELDRQIALEFAKQKAKQELKLMIAA
jgi:hypothetical protein